MSKELKDFIDKRIEDELVMLCNEIYDWHATGNLSEDSHIYGISKDFSCSCNHVEELILNRSAERLEKVVLLLLEKRPTKFLKSIPAE